ncbi:dihydrolipoamide acetyltransferase family protein [Amycolatopsis alkalitolerans]|uniref:Dihydrolipoamide acetyltransferase component of pyruvate dehydrogenase complex n=1 Tax=Amycolatopsis alkalitolerans TaxID=2547244 RepID=A0A5C4M8P7_9PSEU|nr:dihydrolipoamide acetyltransferase family protein [Amycolatopsis alkalitolerans]TNC29476.1 2-oxo acid dehydrogenase subunit E2 [Amycolatopsis alkalitolerans]
MKETPLVMPKLSMTMTEGVLVGWRKAEGDEVRAGDVVCEVTTDKVDMEVEGSVDGTLIRIVAQPEDVVAVGEPIAYLATTADDLLDGVFDGPVEAEAVPEPELVEATPARCEVGQAAAPPGWIPAVPAARNAAAERGLDLATVTPSGPGGTIRLADLPPVRPRRSPRTAIARRMSASAEVPQFVLYRDLDLVPSPHGWTTMFVRAFAKALRRHPELNAEWADGQVRSHDHVGVAVAVDTERGLLAPVLSDPDLDDPGALRERIGDVVRRARAGKLALGEMSGGTTTVSNLGGFGVDAFQALLSPPQATALSLGAVRQRVVPVPGGIGVALRCTVGLTIDHRVADGADAARLLGTLNEVLAC